MKKIEKKNSCCRFVFCFRLLLAIASIQVQNRELIPGGPNTDSFPAKGLQNLVSKEQEIKQFKWTIEAVADLKVRLKQSQQPGTRLETVVTESGKKAQKKFATQRQLKEIKWFSS